MKEALINSLNSLGLAWWVEVKTDSPRFTYYFGPFLNQASAIGCQAGYVEDLEREGASNIQVLVKRCKPTKLTISEEGDGNSPGNLMYG